MLNKTAENASYLQLVDVNQIKDFKTYLARAKSLDAQASVRLITRGMSVGAYVCALAPETLIDTTPTILGLRALNIASAQTLDTTVEISAVLDRLARIDQQKNYLFIPPVVTTASWSGQLPPFSDWAKIGRTTVGELKKIALDGMNAVDSALPANPGHAVLATVRSRIWSSPMPWEAIENQEYRYTPENYTLPSGIAFAAEVLGFLPPVAHMPVYIYHSEGWIRLSCPMGHVLCKKSASSE
ncbi:transcriptional regulator [Rothia sp. CCM 9418]|uniref:transcriptional regulator n=1 Tax=Rothia sp. CCM 9418 TaxID=3402661 RepID=UPI003AE855FF